MPEPVVAYLDHAATSPLRPEVAEAVAAVRAEGLGNPSGAHRLARAARRRLDDAREEVASVIGCKPGEVVFTSGGTEADNLAVLGRVAAAGAAGAVAVCPATEHHAVLDAVEATVAALDGTRASFRRRSLPVDRSMLPPEGVGGASVVVPVDRSGAVDLEALDDALRELGGRVAVVSVMLANNETGVVADLSEVAATVDGRAPLHTDAVAAARWLDLRHSAAPADLITVTAHKLGGPVGIGALVVRDGTDIAPRQLGGGQERGRRSGTADVAGAVGFAAALRLAADERAGAVERVAKQRDRLVAGLVAAVDGAVETLPAGSARVPAIAHLCIAGVEAEALLFLLDERGVCASAASSCSSGAQQASHVLTAMGVDPALSRGSVRLSLAPSTTEAEVDAALAAVPAAVDQLRAGAP